jgi:hypothetical protein
MMGSGKPPERFAAVVWAAVFVLSAAPAALAAVVMLDASSQIVALDQNTSGLNNAILLSQPGGPSCTVAASGNASFGSLPAEFYDSAVAGYVDNAGLLQYAAMPMNGPAVPLAGTHFNYALITDNLGDNVGNTGTCMITQKVLSTMVGGGDIFAGSTTPAQTGVAQLSNANAAIFNIGTTPAHFTITVTGQAFYAPGKEYGSVVVQYRDATNGISYDSLPIGQTRDYFGFRPRVFITDFDGQTSDDSGLLTVAHSLVIPEPATAMLAGFSFVLPLLHRRRRTLGTNKHFAP